MKRFMTFRVLAVSLVLLVGVILIILMSRSAFRRSSALQQSATTPQVLSLTSASNVSKIATPAVDCDKCLQNCRTNCMQYGDTPTTAENQRCEDTCQIQCSDQCGGTKAGGNKTPPRKYKYKLGKH